MSQNVPHFSENLTLRQLRPLLTYAQADPLCAAD